MRRWITMAMMGMLLSGCSGDTRVLVGDVSDHLSHDIMDSVLGFLFKTGDTAAKPATEKPTQPGDVQAAQPLE